MSWGSTIEFFRDTIKFLVFYCIVLVKHTYNFAFFGIFAIILRKLGFLKISNIVKRLLKKVIVWILTK